jgi:hypothetical protein
MTFAKGQRRARSFAVSLHSLDVVPKSLLIISLAAITFSKWLTGFSIAPASFVVSIPSSFFVCAMLVLLNYLQEPHLETDLNLEYISP